MADVNKLKVGEVVLVKFHYNHVVGKFHQILKNPLFASVFKIDNSNKQISKKMICYSWQIYKLTVVCA